MILRAIPKKILQSETRANPSVPVSAAGFEMLPVATGVKNGKNHDALLFDQKVNHKWEAANDRAANFSSYFCESFGMVGNLLKIILYGGAKFLSQAFALACIPSDRIVKLLFRNAAKNKTAFHLRYFVSSFALTSTKETTSSGRSRWSWNRRSISSASPGVSSCDWAISFQRFRHNSTCSANGRRFAVDKNFATNIGPIYASKAPRQAVFCTSANRCNPVGVGDIWSPRTQGSSRLATLGWMIQSLRDWSNGFAHACFSGSCITQHASLSVSRTTHHAARFAHAHSPFTIRSSSFFQA